MASIQRILGGLRPCSLGLERSIGLRTARHWSRASRSTLSASASPIPSITRTRPLSTTMAGHAAWNDFQKHNEHYVAEKHQQHADLPIQPAKKLAVGVYRWTPLLSIREPVFKEHILTKAPYSRVYGCSDKHAVPSWTQGGRCPYHPQCGRSCVSTLPLLYSHSNPLLG
jgi:hypothetical protein